jgi:hypothetical protein
MAEHWAYCGLVDDFALRNRFGTRIADVRQLNEHLVVSALMGDPLLINDGYVLMNPAVRDAMNNTQISPLRDLVERGFVRVLSRNRGDLRRLPDQMADASTTTAIDLRKRPDFDTVFVPMLDRMTTDLTDLNEAWFEPWPDLDTSFVFQRLGDQILERLVRADGALGRDLDVFRNELGRKKSSRTSWEDSAKRLHRNAQISDSTRDLLLVASNEAYQYSWGAVLATGARSVEVQTGATQFLADLDLVADALPAAMPSPVTFFVPNLSVVRAAVGDPWRKLGEVAAVGSDANRAKRTFRTTLADYHAGRCSHGQADDAARAYSKALSTLFGHEEGAQAVTGVTMAVVSIAASVVVTGPLGIAIGIGLTGAGLATSFSGPVRRLVARMGQVKPERWITSATDPRSTVSSFELDPRAMTAVLEGAPRFRP